VQNSSKSQSKQRSENDSVTKRRMYHLGRSTLSLEFGDITSSKADVLVSSDDWYLTMGGGVSAAIRRAAGESILLEAAKKIPAKLGDVVVTGAGSLPAKHVFHVITIGEDDAIAEDIVLHATRKALRLLRTLGLSSIAFPAIGAGAAGFAYADVAANMARAIVDELQHSKESIDVTIYLFDRFGRMEPIDYVQFFEEFAARTHGLSSEPVKRTKRTPVKRPRKQRLTSPQVKTRSEVLEELTEFDRERQALEGRLAEYGSAMVRAEVRKIESRLKEIQERRVALLSTVAARPNSAVSVFLSYSHADEALKKELRKHLKLLERQGIISTWHDRMIRPGEEWDGAIHTHLNDCRVILLLISSDFIDSEYCYGVEMRRALERHEKRSALVIPIILRPVSLVGSPFAKLQALPKDAKPVVKWDPVDDSFVDITESLRTAIQDLDQSGRKPREVV
jgi:O-acetyl-ADP-ribose deacetylase (regulator of RNase III)